MNRSVDTIWDLLARQEEEYGLLDEYARLWQELHPVTVGAGSADPLRCRVRADLDRLRLLQQSNARMAQALLSAVRKAMSEVTSGTPSTRHVYNRRGRAGSGASALLIRRFG